METLDYIQTSISSIAIVISLLALFQNKRSKKSSVIYEMTQQANLINNSTMPYSIKGPYAVLRGISDNKEEIAQFEALHATFLHQVNLLSIVYHNKGIIGTKVFNGYVDWIATVFRPWVESNDDLIWAWKKLKETKDLLGEDFILWLDKELKIYRDKAA